MEGSEELLIYSTVHVTSR